MHEKEAEGKQQSVTTTTKYTLLKAFNVSTETCPGKDTE